jgi:Xaa-Pro dipeptidase
MHERMRACDRDTLRECGMRQDIIDRQAQAMKAAGLDATLSCSPENFAYVTGFLSPTQKLMRWRHAMALVTADGTVALAVVDMEASTIRARAGEGVEIAVWREFAFEAMKVAADLLRRHGLAEARIGLELDYLPAADFAELAGLLPSAKFVAAQGLLARLRQIKTADEIDLLRRLSRIGEQGIIPVPPPCLLPLSAPVRPRWTSPPRSPAASTSRVRSPSR